MMYSWFIDQEELDFTIVENVCIRYQANTENKTGRFKK